MSGPNRLNDVLKVWATASGVTLHWQRGTLRLELGHTTEARNVVSFPAGFWELFEGLPAADQREVLARVASDIQLRYEPGYLGAVANDIQIPITFAREEGEFTQAAILPDELQDFRALLCETRLHESGFKLQAYEKVPIEPGPVLRTILVATIKASAKYDGSSGAVSWLVPFRRDLLAGKFG
jgi:hypothetical protein